MCRTFTFDYVRGRNNPVMKDKSVRNCIEERTEENDVFFYDKLCENISKIAVVERIGALQSILNCLIALRDIGNIVNTMMPSKIPYELPTCQDCIKNYHIGMCDLIKYHCEFFLPEDKNKFNDSLEELLQLDYSQKESWQNLINIRKGILITIGIDIKINTSVGLFALKNKK
jgi:hypothetical protein